jgi:hypothetical protein
VCNFLPSCCTSNWTPLCANACQFCGGCG